MPARADVNDGGFLKYGVREELDGGDFMETYGLALGAGNVGRETLTFAAGTQPVALRVPRPLGVVFEEVDGRVVAVELVPESNAEEAGVQVGDVLRMTSAVAVGGARRVVCIVVCGGGRTLPRASRGSSARQSSRINPVGAHVRRRSSLTVARPWP